MNEDLKREREREREDIIHTSRCGPIVEINAQDPAISRNLWNSCLVGFLLEERSFFPRRLQTILNRASELQG